MQQETHESARTQDVLGDSAFTAEELARACGMPPTWVHERVQAGVLRVNLSTGDWRFDSTMLVRARRVAQLETIFDADPQLAALTADLIDDVNRLRRRLEMLGGSEGA
jgi:chaperone modulatory protein CbpM